MAGVRWEIMLFAAQAGLQESPLTKCLDKTCLQWLLGDIHNQSMAPCGFKISLLMREFISFFRVLKLRRKKKTQHLRLRADYSVIAIKQLSGVRVCE